MNSRRTRIWCILLLMICSCKDEKVEVTPLSEVIDFSIDNYDHLVETKAIKADGVTMLKLVAKLPKNANADFRTVRFNTSGGSFDVPEADKSQCKVVAVLTDDDQLEATAYLTLSRTSGKYSVSAAIDAKPAYKSEIVFDVLPLNVSDFIDIRVQDLAQLISEGELKADGLTKIKVIASVPRATMDADRQIEFKTSDGAFDVTDASKLSKTVTAVLQHPGDTVLQAFAYLTMGVKPGIYNISANIVGKEIYEAETDITVLPIKISDVLQLAFEPAIAIRADGISTFKAIASVTGIPVSKITISTTDGQILDSPDGKTKDLDILTEGSAAIDIRSGTEVKNYVVTAKIPNTAYILSKTYSLSRAYPDKLTLEPSQLMIDTTGGSITVNIFLKRDRGKVSIGTAVSLKAYQVNDDHSVLEVGRFTGRNNTSDDDGKITVQYFADTGSIIKGRPITLEVSCPKDDGTVTMQSLKLTIK